MPRDSTVFHVLDVLVSQRHRLSNVPAVIPDLEVRSTVHHEDAVTLLRAQVIHVQVTSHLVDRGLVGHSCSLSIAPLQFDDDSLVT